MKKTYLLALFFSGFVLALSSVNPASASGFPLRVDNCGEELEFTEPPQRAVIHDINMVEMAFSLDLQDYLVGVTGISGWYKTNAQFEARRGDIPELAAKYPTLENLVAVEADFFFAGWYYGMRPGGEVTPLTLKSHNIKTLILSESCIHIDAYRAQRPPRPTIERLLFDDVARLGLVFGVPERAEAQIEAWRARLRSVEQLLEGVDKLTVFLFDSGDDKPFTAGRYAITTALIDRAGGVNIMEDMETSWGRTSWETVALRDPEFLILLNYGGGKNYLESLDFLKQHPAMQLTGAVQHERFLPLRYEELTPGPANIEAIEKLARAMHPERF